MGANVVYTHDFALTKSTTYNSKPSNSRVQATRGAIFEQINHYLGEQGRRIKQGNIVNATIIQAPISTKNRRQIRESKMHQTRKGNQSYFGIKGHVGVNNETKLIELVVATPGSQHESQVMGELLHGNETRVRGDSAYTGQGEVIREEAPRALDLTD